MKTPKIGEFITVGDEVFKCVNREDSGCGVCDFKDLSLRDSCYEHECNKGFGHITMFILYDTTHSDENDD